MNKLNLLKMARESGVALIRQDDGSYLLPSTSKSFADRIESAVSDKYETARQKDHQDLTALRHQVQNLAGENIQLRAHIKNARECLDGEGLL